MVVEYRLCDTRAMLDIEYRLLCDTRAMLVIEYRLLCDSEPCWL